MAVRPSNLAAIDTFLAIHAVRVYVRDVDRSLQFYTEKLGFRLVIDTKLQSGERWVAVSPPDGTTILTLVAPKAKTAEHKLIGRATQVVLVTPDVMRKFQEWSQRGVRFLSAPRLRRIKYDHGEASGRQQASRLLGRESPIWGTASARFSDIDGNVFSLVSFDELTHAIEAERREEAERLAAERHAARELEIAKQVQSRLFPQCLPPFQRSNTREAAFRRVKWAAITMIFSTWVRRSAWNEERCANWAPLPGIWHLCWPMFAERELPAPC